MKRLLVVFFIFHIFMVKDVFAAEFFDALPEITSISLGGGVDVSPQNITDEKTRETTVSGVIPHVSENAYLAGEIEEIIDSQKQAAATAGASSLAFSYTIAVSEDYGTVSFLIKSVFSAGSSWENVSSLVIFKETLTLARVTDILGGCGLKLATGVVNNYIVQNYRSMPRISTLSNDCDFYCLDDGVYFVFDKYEIAPGSEGLQVIPVYFENLTTFTVSRDEYYVNKEKYNIRMLPLRHVVQAFGYRAYWNGASQEITVSASGPRGAQSIKIKINENSYIKPKETAPLTLEAPPEIKDGLTYIPITFMEAMLDINYHVMPNGSIELALYSY